MHDREWLTLQRSDSGLPESNERIDANYVMNVVKMGIESQETRRRIGCLYTCHCHRISTAVDSSLQRVRVKEAVNTPCLHIGRVANVGTRLATSN